MANQTRKSRKPRKVEDLINPATETQMMTSAIDHVSQLSSWGGAFELTEAEAATLEAPVEQPQASAFDSIVAALTDEDIEAMVFRVADELDARADFETRTDPGNANIHRTLKNVRKMLVTRRCARVLLACAIDPSFINRSIHEGSRYNIYALGKFADAVVALTGGKIANAINNAVIRSLFRAKANGVTFTSELAKAAASDKIRVDSTVRSWLVRHTVSASTAPTQASSTMQALETLGIVSSAGSRSAKTYTLTAAPAVAKLEGVLETA